MMMLDNRGSSSRKNDAKREHRQSDGGGDVCRKGLASCACDAELTLLPHPALLGRVVYVRGGRNPETKETEENSNGGCAHPPQMTLPVHHGLLVISREAIASCQDSTQ